MLDHQGGSVLGRRCAGENFWQEDERGSAWCSI